VDGRNVNALKETEYNWWYLLLMDSTAFIGKMLACLGGFMLPPLNVNLVNLGWIRYGMRMAMRMRVETSFRLVNFDS
jgi:peptidoglycan biosynthesis protein MviN/MurJ (putative lipid II flippase)